MYIIDRARDFLNSNNRLQKALESAVEKSEKVPEVSLEIKEKVDARLKNPLKGISKSLLEKVRAKQVSLFPCFFFFFFKLKLIKEK